MSGLSRRMPILGQLADAATEREAAVILLHLPLGLAAVHGPDLAGLMERRGFRACGLYLDNLDAALRLARKADPRFPGDLGAARVALALQTAGLTLQAAMDGAEGRAGEGGR